MDIPDPPEADPIEIVYSPPQTDFVEPVILKESPSEFTQPPEQRLAADIDRRPVLQIDERRKFAEVEYSISETGYEFQANAIKETYEIARPFFESDCGSVNELTFSATDNRIAIDGLLIETAQKLVEKLAAEFAGDTSQFINSEETLPRGNALPVTSIEDIPEPYQFAPLSNKAISPREIEEYCGEEAIRKAKKIDCYEASADPSRLGDGTIHGWANENRGGAEASCSVFVEDGVITGHECMDADHHHKPCEHVALALLLAPDVSPSYISGDQSHSSANHTLSEFASK